MRKAINENPMVQIAILGIAVVAFALIFMSSMGGGGSETPAPSDPGAAVPEGAASSPATSAPDVPGAPVTPATPSTGTTDPATGATPGTTTPPATSAPAEPPVAGGTVDSADGMLPSKGLPQALLVAYAKGDAIALLVTNPRSLSSPEMKGAVKGLEKRNDVTAFVVESDDIAKYSRITSGVSLSRVPALIVIRPRDLTDNVPTAAVSYGFRGEGSVNQAVDDALYEGRQRAAYP